MKEIMLMSIVLQVVFSSLHAQEKFVDGNMTIGKETYRISSSTYKSLSRIFAYNTSKNVADVPALSPEDVRKVLPIRDEDMHFDFAKEKQILLRMLTAKIQQLKSKNESIGIKYVFYPSGKIMNIEFTLDGGTIITPIEISKIDRDLRKDLQMKFTGEQYHAHPSIFFNKRRILFSDL